MITKRTATKVVRSTDFNQNARRNAEALKAMTETERWCGQTVEELEAFHAEQRARVRQRYGLEAA